MRTFAVLTAAGQSRRMVGTDKLTLPLLGRPLIAHTALAFLSWPRLDGLMVAVTAGREQEMAELIQRHCPSPEKLVVRAGGRERQDSIRLALEELDKLFSPAQDDLILIHDAARPLVEHSLFENLLAALESCDGVIPATPVRDTVKRVQGSNVLLTEDRETLRMVQTPQVFRFGLIMEVHRAAHRDGYVGTDDASLVERGGGRVEWITGPAHNLKVTVPEDVALLSELARAWGATVGSPT